MKIAHEMVLAFCCCILILKRNSIKNWCFRICNFGEYFSIRKIHGTMIFCRFLIAENAPGRKNLWNKKYKNVCYYKKVKKMAAIRKKCIIPNNNDNESLRFKYKFKIGVKSNDENFFKFNLLIECRLKNQFCKI